MPRRKGISPVIATVIIVAVTIAVAIAVAFWMTGIIGLFTGFEQLQIVSIYDEEEAIFVVAKNAGTQTASIVDVHINGKSVVHLGAGKVTLEDGETKTLEKDQGEAITLKPGESKKLKITVKKDVVGTIGPGDSVEIKLISATGKEYPKILQLQAYKAEDT